MYLSVQTFNIRDEIKNVIEMITIKTFKRMLEVSVYFDPGLPETLSGDVWNLRLLFYTIYRFVVRVAVKKTKLQCQIGVGGMSNGLYPITIRLIFHTT
jgi:hypothetical protein